MHPGISRTPNPLDVASHSERFSRERGGDKMGLVFSAITAISLGVMTTKMIVDMVRDTRSRSHGRDR